MVKIRKSLVSAVLAFLMLVAARIPVFAEDQVVFDQMGMFTREQLQELESYGLELEEKTGWEVFLVTKDTFDGRTTREYADDFFDERTTVEDSGIVLLLDMYVREIYISTAGEAQWYLNDSRIETVLDAGYDYISDGSYTEGLKAMLDETENYYDKGIPDNQELYNEDTGESVYYRKLTVGEIIATVIAAVVPALIIWAAVNGSYRKKISKYVYDYRKNAKLDLIYHNDQFINKTVHTRRIPKSTGSGGGGGGSSHRSSSHRSSSHRSSSGRSHGGGGRRF